MEAVNPDARALQDRPELYEDLQDIWNAFWELSPSRQVGMGIGAIPIGEMVIYWRDLKGIQGSGLSDKVELIRRMDVSYIEYRSKKDNR